MNETITSKVLRIVEKCLALIHFLKKPLSHFNVFTSKISILYGIRAIYRHIKLLDMRTPLMYQRTNLLVHFN